ncbi:FUSC family protein [Granulicella mallensis]|uniref:Fusaric acid resistance protein conserved region n=1 Tax=Granulicella mallensis (strain ATCC BAA-1857 / DSM 23137 / MP5ACTX8) TaxID=682795 RepID=G8NZW9_GRAMM|nr:FUSC family protein [Granulicella mallensis]AEU34596.1 Fusaric acid resistance protein conserved region [Granulicella mallensis MP5ACTX8]
MSRTLQAFPSISRAANVVRAELAMYPGRLSLIFRIVLACTSVMVLVMVFRIPAAALGAYYPLLLSRDSPRATRRSALRTSIACTLGAAEIILGAMLFAGSPFLHFFWLMANLFAVFYLISAMKLYDAAVALGVLIASAMTIWDTGASPATRVTLTLYTLLSILMGCVISAIIETVFAQTHPSDAVLDGIQQRLVLAEKLLRKGGDIDADHASLRIQIGRYATRGTGELREHLAHSSYDGSYKAQLTTVVALSGQLIELSVNLGETIRLLSPSDVVRCNSIAQNIAGIRSRLVQEEAPDWLELSGEHEHANPTLAEIERNIELIAESFSDSDPTPHHHLPEPGEQQKMGIFQEDAFSNPEHLKFAIRGTLSAMACYLFYMSLGWMFLAGSVTTCILTALTNTGATRHKQLLRFAGFFLGACILGFGAETLILPQIDSLAEYTLLFAFVMAIGAWAATSSPRLAYLGFQIVLAYDLTNLNRFTLNTSLVPARDAILGIVLGIIAMWLFFDHLWSRSATVTMRAILLTAIRDVAQLEHSSNTEQRHEMRRFQAECDRINRNFDKIRTLSDLSVFESFPKSRHETFMTHCVESFLPQLRAYLLVKAGLLQYGTTNGSQQYAELVDEVKHRTSALLLGAAQTIEQYPEASVGTIDPGDRRLLHSVKQATREAQGSGQESSATGLRLSSSLLDLALHVQMQLHAPPSE